MYRSIYKLPPWPVLLLSFGFICSIPSISHAAFGDIIQRVEAANSDVSLTAVYGATPTTGNLLIAVHLTGAASSDLVASGGNNWSSGYHWQNTTEADAVRLWYRLATASEAMSVTATPDASDENGLLLLEIEGPWELSPLDQTTDPGRATGATYSTGTSATTAQADEVAIASVYSRNTENTGTTWSQSFVGHDSSSIASNYKSVSLATKLLTAIGAIETTYTLTGSTIAMGGLATFKKSSGGGPPPFRIFWGD